MMTVAQDRNAGFSTVGIMRMIPEGKDVETDEKNIESRNLKDTFVQSLRRLRKVT